MNKLICFTLLSSLVFALAQAATFRIQNLCPYTVWAAAIPGGGQQLNPGQTWTLRVKAGTTRGRIWGRTKCVFDANGSGNCQSGGCHGILECHGYGVPPNTLAEYTLNKVNDMDFYDISLVNGFNIAMEFSPTTGSCKGVRCTADINGQCPDELRAPGGCNNPCVVFSTSEYCCSDGTAGSCGPTNYSTFFKDRCRDAYSYPFDDVTSTFTCPSTGGNYKVVFCP